MRTEPVYSKCEACGCRGEMISNAETVCDNCSARTDDKYLNLIAFQHKSDEAREYDFCSWRCVFAKLPSISCDSFVSLPYLHYDEGDGPTSARAFFELVAAEAGK